METIVSKSIFSLATGYLQRGGFAWTCNPYVGCTFGCRYCYAMYLPQNRRPRADWGQWLQAKSNAVELAQRDAPKVAGQAVYLSSVTDPSLPVERRLGLTRGILDALLPRQPRLMVQTRGPMVTRDFDLLTQFDRIRLNVTISTDDEAVRRAFEPKAPPLDRRWAALHAAKARGIPVGVCVTPMLPLRNPTAFRAKIMELDPQVLVVQDFHDSHGSFGANTGDAAKALVQRFGWSAARYAEVKAAWRTERMVYEGEAGFFPP